jgi:hypothetical protein
LILLASAAAARAEPAVVLGETVEVSGLTPGGKAAWWSVAHEAQEYHRRVVRRGGIEQDTDNDGRVVLPALGPPAIHSIWVVVDVASGATTVAAPEGFEIQALEFGPGEGLSGAAPGEVDRLVALREELVVLAVRPGDSGAGAWDLGHAGVRVVSRATRVATGTAGAETTSTTTERYDRELRTKADATLQGLTGSSCFFTGVCG